MTLEQKEKTNLHVYSEIAPNIYIYKSMIFLFLFCDIYF